LGETNEGYGIAMIGKVNFDALVATDQENNPETMEVAISNPVIKKEY